MSRRHGHNSSDMQLGVKDSTASIITNSHSFMAGGSTSSNSSTAALQSLAARNARNNPSSSSSSTTGISAGSILQNALSGATGGRGNPGFAPTLAQLLTYPAAEQQQQQVQQKPQLQQQQQQQVMGPSSTALQSAAEVLTLSNLLATAKVEPLGCNLRISINYFCYE